MKSILLYFNLIYFLLFTSVCLQAQKVKYKKGKILVNKEHKYDLLKIKSEDKTEGLDSYVLKDIDGKVLMSLNEKLFYYSQLPYEKSEKVALRAYTCEIPELGLQKSMPYHGVMGYGKQRYKDLKEVGFFKNGTFDESIFNAFIDKQRPESLKKKLDEIEKTNSLRKEYYTRTQEKIGDLEERNPRKAFITINTKRKGGYLIKQGNTIIAYINPSKKGSHSHPYTIETTESLSIAKVNIFQKPVKKNGFEYLEYNVIPEVWNEKDGKNGVKLYSEKIKAGLPSDSIEKKFQKVANFMLDHGML